MQQQANETEDDDNATNIKPPRKSNKLAVYSKNINWLLFFSIFVFSWSSWLSSTSNLSTTVFLPILNDLKLIFYHLLLGIWSELPIILIETEECKHRTLESLCSSVRTIAYL